MRKSILPASLSILLSACGGHDIPSANSQPAVLEKSPELLWKFSAGGPVQSTPALAEGVVCFYSSPVLSKSISEAFHVLDAATGRERWRWERDTLNLWYHSGKSPVGMPTASAAIWDGLVFFAAWSETGLFSAPSKSLLACAVLDGRIEWERTKVHRDAGDMIAGNPLSAKDGILCFMGSLKFLVLEARTGREKWTYTPWEGWWTSPSRGPALSEGVVCFGDYSGYIHAMDTETGRSRWKFRTCSGEVGPLTIHDGVVYAGARYSGHDEIHAGDAYLLAIDLKSGKEIWRFETESLGEIANEEGSLKSRPAVSKDLVCFMHPSGYLFALDVKSGAEIWRLTTEAREDSTPAVAHGIVCYGSRDGHLYMLDARTGEEIGKYKTDGAVADPVVSEGVVYFGSMDGFLYALKI